MLSPTVLLEQVTVLVIDDEEPLRRYITRVMEDAGYQVLTARDGFEGLALLEQSRSHVRLVVTDVSMPRMTVPELAARVPPSHTRYPCSSCPVIVATPIYQVPSSGNRSYHTS